MARSDHRSQWPMWSSWSMRRRGRAWQRLLRPHVDATEEATVRHDSAPGATHPGTSITQSAGSVAGYREGTLRDLPVHERRQDLAGIPTAVLEGGDGPTVVLLHGPGEFAALWGRVVSGLSETHRVVVPDLPGHGATDLP